MTPEQALRAAAAKLREAASAAQRDVNTSDFWACYPPATAWREGLVNGFGGVTGDYAALMHPGVGLAIAVLLADVADSVADDGGIVQDSASEAAVTIAHAILGDQT